MVTGLASAFPAMAGEMTASEARHFVVEKLFSYTCFDGTRGMARVHADGSVDGSIQVRGGLPRYGDDYHQRQRACQQDTRPDAGPVAAERF